MYAEKLIINYFHASDGWLSKYCTRTNFKFKTLSGESGSVNQESADDFKKTTLPDLIKNYNPQDIFNVDETGLFLNVCLEKVMFIKVKHVTE